MIKSDILIVGAGLSGLALADHLTRAKADYRLIEAQDRLGGRILTKTLSGGAFDLGPAWFWPGQPRMAALADRFGIPVFEQYASGDLMYQNQNGTVQRGRGYASMQGSLRLAGGMAALVDALAATLDPTKITTNARLTDITRGENGYTATVDQNGQKTTLTAAKIALALPPRVIADTINFAPALDPTQIQTLHAIPTWMAGQAKIIATYNRPYWRDAGLSGDAMSHQGPMVEIHDASPMNGGPYALFGFFGVPVDLRARHKNALLHQARAQLTALFGPQMANPLDLVLQDWATIPQIARPKDRQPIGGHPAYGLSPNLRDLATRGIHLTATETAQDFGGFLEGALEAAERTALALIS